MGIKTCHRQGLVRTISSYHIRSAHAPSPPSFIKNFVAHSRPFSFSDILFLLPFLLVSFLFWTLPSCDFLVLRCSTLLRINGTCRCHRDPHVKVDEARLWGAATVLSLRGRWAYLPEELRALLDEDVSCMQIYHAVALSSAGRRRSLLGRQ